MKIKLIKLNLTYNRPNKFFAIEFNPVIESNNNKKDIINSLREIYLNSKHKIEKYLRDKKIYNILLYAVNYNSNILQAENFPKTLENEFNKFNFEIKKYKKIIIYKNNDNNTFGIIKSENKLIHYDKNNPDDLYTQFDIDGKIQYIIITNKNKIYKGNKKYKFTINIGKFSEKTFAEKYGLNFSENKQYIDDNYRLNIKLINIMNKIN